jgi:photosystem II stability/assembly factor-like uncharacterized protein
MRGGSITCATVLIGAVLAGASTQSAEASSGEFLAIDPVTPTTLYASITDDSAKVFKSTDGGGSWNLANTGLTIAVQVLAVDPNTPSTLYAGCDLRYDTTCDIGVFKSVDGGASWHAAGFTGGISGIAIDPVHSTTLYAISGDVFKSFDAGSNWQPTGAVSANTNASVAALVVTSTTLYAAINLDSGTRASIIQSTDGGASWSAPLPSAPAGPDALVVDPVTPSTFYVVANGRVFKSTDAGTTWFLASEGLPDTVLTPGGTLRDLWVEGIVIDPHTSSTLYVRTKPEGVYKSTDAATSWQPTCLVPFSRNPKGGQIDDLVIDPVTPNTLYAAPLSGACGGFGDLTVYKTTDGGSTWRVYPPCVVPDAITCANPTPTPSSGLCIGDCDGTDQVTVNEILTLVNIALGNAEASACPAGVTAGAVDIAVILQAVNNALNGCAH